MSDLGPIQLEEKSEGVFLGRDYNKNRDFSDAVALEIDREVKKIIDGCMVETKKILKKNEKLVWAISDALMERETITKEEIEELVETGHITDKENDSLKKLKDLAKEAGIKGYTKMTKEELEKALNGEKEEKKED
jgi:cell division protease FtsH